MLGEGMGKRHHISLLSLHASLCPNLIMSTKPGPLGIQSLGFS